MEIRIERPTIKERHAIHDIFERSIEKVFLDNEIYNRSDYEMEVIAQKKCLESDYESEGKVNHYLIAKVDGQVVGTAAYGPVNCDILGTIEAAKDALEVKGVYVHPDYQRQGVGRLLYHSIVSSLANEDVDCFYLDCGYSTSQKFWESELGEASYIIENKWGKGAHYKIWKVALEISCLLEK